MRRRLNKRTVLRALMIALVVAFASLALIMLAVHLSVRDRVYASVRQVRSANVAIVLGTRALPNGRPSDRLANRCDKAVELYKAGKVKKIVMSGDNRAFSHHECDVMRRYAIENGVAASDVTIDHLGLRTYDSMYRAKNVFGIKRAIVVTQRFHIERSMFYARAVGIDAYGVPSDLPPEFRDRFREPLAVVLSVMDVYFLQRPEK
jgi:SanA protein